VPAYYHHITAQYGEQLGFPAAVVATRGVAVGFNIDRRVSVSSPRELSLVLCSASISVAVAPIGWELELRQRLNALPNRVAIVYLIDQCPAEALIATSSAPQGDLMIAPIAWPSPEALRFSASLQDGSSDGMNDDIENDNISAHALTSRRREAAQCAHKALISLRSDQHIKLGQYLSLYYKPCAETRANRHALMPFKHKSIYLSASTIKSKNLLNAQNIIINPN
jgi:hypothetical protein